MVQWTLGDFDEAIRHIDRSLPVLREVARPNHGSVSRFQLRVAYCTASDNTTSPSLAIRTPSNFSARMAFEIGVARALSGLGSAYQAVGLLAAALECHKDSLSIAETAEHAIGLSRALTDLGTSL